MSIIFFCIFFTALLIFGYLAVKSKWKIKNLAFVCFVSVFLFVFSVFLLILHIDGRYVQFFYRWEVFFKFTCNRPIFCCRYVFFLATLLLVIVVWAVRNKVF